MDMSYEQAGKVLAEVMKTKLRHTYFVLEEDAKKLATAMMILEGNAWDVRKDEESRYWITILQRIPSTTR